MGMMTPASLRWDSVDSGGWQYLVGALPAARILCYDVGAGAVALLLAGLCHEVVVLQPNSDRRSEIRKQAELLGLRNLRIHSPDELFGGDGSALGIFDGFVLHDPQALVLCRDNADALTVLLEAVQRTLQAGAFVYLGVRHRYGYDRFLKRRRAQHAGPVSNLWSGAVLERRVRSSGFRNIQTTPILLDRGRVSEIIPSQGYTSVKNRFLLTEHIKELVLGHLGSGYFAPFYALVAYRKEPGQSFLEQLIGYLRCQALNGVMCPEQLSLKRYFVLNGGKVILSLGTTDQRQRKIIVVLVHDGESARRRELEGVVLNTLAQLPAALSTRIPKLLHSMIFLGVHCFVLSELPGVTVDAPTPRLKRITRYAVQFLIELHKATPEQYHITSASYPALIGDLFSVAREKYPALVSALSSLEMRLRQAVLGREITCVRFHGDYKIENVMVNSATDEVTGVIDWELSRTPGLPLLDMIYLLVYNRMIHGSNWLNAFQEIALQARRDQQEQAVWAEYLKSIPVAPDLVPALYVLFVVHHIGCRLYIDLSQPGREHEMCDMIQSLETILQKRDVDESAQPVISG